MVKFVAAGRQNGGSVSIMRGHLQFPESGVHVLRRFDTHVVSIERAPDCTAQAVYLG